MSEKVRIYQLAKELGIDNRELLEHLDNLGVEYKSHSSSLDEDVAETVRQLVADEKRARTSASGPGTAVTEAVTQPAATVAPVTTATPAADAPHRAPVVTVMGHVDHGKTSLLDYIRKTKVAAGEAGGITQHIGAYQAETPGGLITFLDTPGHEAFTSIRQRGASATDIAVIVVAADDSIMPQTREAIAHAKAAGVPIVVAINKTDLPQADVDRVKRDLMRLELVPEDFGGDTITAAISAKTGDGVDNLLEMISLVAELEDLRAPVDGTAEGVIIESVLDKRAGVLATVLVQKGTLRVADYLVSGEVWAKIRRMTDEGGKAVTEAGPSVPVQILGFSEQPVAGAKIVAVRDETSAKALVSERRETRQDETLEAEGKKGMTLADLFGKPKVTTINLILRADTQGSLEAIKGVIARESEQVDEVDVDIMLDAVGAPTESDLLLASTADATVMSFGVTAPGSVKKAAERQGIPLKSYRIIYELIEDVQRMIRGQIEPEFEEQVLGHAEVRQVIRVPRSGNIAGSYITDGTIRRGSKARLLRAGKEVYKGSISQLRRFKDDVREVSTGFECGINLQNYENVQEGDVIEAYDMVEVPFRSRAANVVE
ncbi:MAG: Translation initiation factor 2 [uncultured Truepera sp.]|uniref:Translation initiation factor IF-2 n=1 Tax=uncultured Truepera sp. TaxID=543023 RepID=A0A6J4V8D8_9DEIN|nr:MAG: Translation initiation factor 2 [uncultured Truepera sp.]